MKNKTIKTLAGRSFASHKGRNLVAIFAVVLTTMMFTTLFVLTQSMSKNAITMAFRQSGYDAHVSFKSINDEQIALLADHPEVVQIGRSIVLGLASNQALSGRQVEVRYADPSYASHSFAAPTTGRLPEGMDEIALDDITLDRLGIPHELGQKVTLDWRGDFSKEESVSKEFILCGFWEG
ncbi:MAG: ABC transporter permease, partial [Lachnospiraceae bacterium]|nr:ABC transporter permease [Lachnospiraceae bacterium]